MASWSRWLWFRFGVAAVLATAITVVVVSSGASARRNPKPPTTTSTSSTTTTSTTTTTMLPVALSSTMLIPSNGATLSGTALLDASASGPVVGVDFRLTGGAYSNTLIGAATSTRYGWIFNWDTSGICGGSYSLAARAFDGSGNSAYSPSITISIGEAVSTSLLIPGDGTTLSGTTTLDASVTGVVKSIDFRATGNGYSNVLLGAASATPWGWLYNWNTMNAPNGTYTLTSHVVDCRGDSVYSAPVTVTVANVPAPNVAPSSPVVHLFGDSIFSQTATYFDFFYGLRGYVVAHNEWPGVAACDDFDLVATMPVPTVAVLSFTGNMFTDCAQSRGAMLDVYAQDVDHLAAILAFRGVPTLWVGGPGRVGTTESANSLLPIYQAVAAKYGQRYINGSSVLEDSTGTYAMYLPCQPADGPAGDCSADGTAQIRDNDQVHLADSGERRYAEYIAAST
jgi:hypothetical protein